MTSRTLLDKPITTCVVCWPEEENKLSIVPAKKIVSPRSNDFAPDTFCKVQGLESHPCKIVAMGTVEEMVKKIRQLEAGEDTEDSDPPIGDAIDEPPPKKKPGVERASRKQKPITTCIVCWPEEENKLSLVSAKKIVSPAQDDFAPDTFCKIKGFETHLCKMVAVGTEADMKKKIRELEAGDDTKETPPKKRPRVEKASKGRKRLGNENRNKPPSQSKKKEGKKGSIILVAAQQSGNTTSAAPSQSTAPSIPLQENTNTTLATPSQPAAPLQNINTTSAAPSQFTTSSVPLQENNNATSATPSQSTAPLQNINTTSAAPSQYTTSSAPLQENTNATPATPSQSAAPLQNINTTSAAPSQYTTSSAPLQENTNATPATPSQSAAPLQNINTTSAAPSQYTTSSAPLQENNNATTAAPSDTYNPYLSDEEETRSIYENHDVEEDQDLSLILNLTVDDHSKRLEKLEGALTRMEMLDAEKTRRIEELELTVSRLLSYPPPPSPRAGPSATLAFTPRPPWHLPPTQGATPPPPRHRPPPLFSSPEVGPSGTVHAAPQLSECFPVVPQQKRCAPRSSVGKLPSSAIDKSVLSSVNSTVQANLDLLGKEAKITTMAAVLAREAYFGEEVMAQCTAQGYGDKPGLPAAEMRELKEEIRRLYPHYLNNSLVFEEKWTKCQESISSACKRARQKLAKKKK